MALFGHWVIMTNFIPLSDAQVCTYMPLVRNRGGGINLDKSFTTKCIRDSRSFERIWAVSEHSYIKI